LFLYFFQGATLGLSATIMPGPFQAYLLSQALKNGWKHTLPLALTPLITDGPIIALVLYALNQTPQYLLDMLRIMGGLFMLYLSRGVFLNLKDSSPIEKPLKKTIRQSFFNAVVMNVLNPNPYIFWGMVAGPILLSGWRESMGSGVSFVIGFYGTFIMSLSVLIITFAVTGKINKKFSHIFGALAGMALLLFGLYQTMTGLLTVAGIG